MRIFPSELIHHDLWWNGLPLLKLLPPEWPKNNLPANVTSEEAEELNTTKFNYNLAVIKDPLIPLDKFSSFNMYKWVIAWMIRFIHNCESKVKSIQPRSGSLSTTDELSLAANYWYSLIQRMHFSEELRILATRSQKIPTSSKLFSLNPIVDDHGILRVSGRQQRARLTDIRSSLTWNIRLPCYWFVQNTSASFMVAHYLYPPLYSATFTFLVDTGPCIRSIVRSCIICRRQSPKPKPQVMGQLPPERITPDMVFEHVGLDFAGLLYLKRGSVHKPTILKSYMCVFVSLSVKAVHLELVSDLSTESCIASLRRFVARRGKPSSIWSDHGTNFVGANRVLKELYAFILFVKAEEAISDFCSTQGITWHLIPEWASHFGGLWEAAVRSFKTHLARVIGNSKLRRLQGDEHCSHSVRGLPQ